MRYVTAIIASIFMFVAVWILSGLVLLFLVPPRWTQIGITIGALHGSLVSVIGAAFGGFVAAYTFKASLKAKTGRLYRRSKPGSERQI